MSIIESSLRTVMYTGQIDATPTEIQNILEMLEQLKPFIELANKGSI